MIATWFWRDKNEQREQQQAEQGISRTFPPTLTVFSFAVLLIAVSIVQESTGVSFSSLHRVLPKQRNNSNHKKGNCKVMVIHLADEKVAEGIFLDGPFRGAPGSKFGGQIEIADASNTSAIIGDYSFSIQFMKTDPSKSYFPCVGSGVYSFGVHDGLVPRDQITWTASCSNSPFLTITGGHGKYLGAKGYVRIKVPVPGGNNHEIHLCDN